MNGHADSVGNDGKKEDEKAAGEKAAGMKEKKPSVFGKAWKKLDLDLGTALMMMK